MANCPYCNHSLPNNKAVAYRCINCNTVWCANGTCNGSSGVRQLSRTSHSMCQTCHNTKGIVKV